MNLAPKDFDYWCVYEKDYITQLNGRNNFKNVFEYYLKTSKSKQKSWSKDITTLERFGYKYEEKNICGKCGKEANKKNCVYSEGFNRKNRRKRIVIRHLRIVSINEYSGE